MFLDALLGAKVAADGGYDACASSSGLSRTAKRSAPVITPPCDPGLKELQIIVLSHYNDFFNGPYSSISIMGGSHNYPSLYHTALP